jgi:uncharacterized protein YoaH (UPF0181 family)
MRTTIAEQNGAIEGVQFFRIGLARGQFVSLVAQARRQIGRNELNSQKDR